MLENNYIKAKSIRERIEELEYILNFSNGINLTGNIDESKKIYASSFSIASTSELLSDIQKSIKKEIKLLEEEFNKI